MVKLSTIDPHPQNKTARTSRSRGPSLGTNPRSLGFSGLPPRSGYLSELPSMDLCFINFLLFFFVFLVFFAILRPFPVISPDLFLIMGLTG